MHRENAANPPQPAEYQLFSSTQQGPPGEGRKKGRADENLAAASLTGERCYQKQVIEKQFTLLQVLFRQRQCTIPLSSSSQKEYLILLQRSMQNVQYEAFQVALSF